jgi:long-chain fatty acid transport protein
MTRYLKFSIYTLSLAGLFVSLPVTAGNGPALTGLVAKADDASTAFTNAAGLTRIPKTQLVGQPTIVYTHGQFKVSEQGGQGGGDADKDEELLLVPSFSWSTPLENDKWIGVTINVPSGIGNDYGSSWAGRYEATKSSLAFVAVTPVMAFKLNENLSVGGGPTLMMTEAETKVNIHNGPLYSGGDGKMKLETDGFSVGWTASLLWEFDKTARAGLTYRSETEPELTGTPSFKNLSPAVNTLLANSEVLGREVDIDMRTPQMVLAGYYQEIDQRWAFSVDAVWVDLSRFGLENIKVGETEVSSSSDYKDVYMASAGLFYKTSDSFTYSVGMMYASSGKDDDDRSFQMPLDEIWGVGVGIAKEISAVHSFHANLNYFSLGDAEIDEGFSTPDQNNNVFEVEGEFEEHYAVALDMGFTMNFD